MIWLRLLKKLLKALNADAAPSEVAGGVVLGAVIGITPTFSLHNLIILVLLIIVKVNISAAIFSAIVFGIAGYAVDGVSHSIGRYLLFSPPLERLWVFLYNTPLLALARLHNTVVLGSLLVSFIIMLPLFALSKKFVLYYRSNLKQKVDKMKIVKILKASKIYHIYKKVKV